jgi:glutamine cyclotransferase
MPVRFGFSFLLLLSLAGCRGSRTDFSGEDPVFRPAILDRLPHDPGAFTQGLLIDGDYWLESTGQYGASELREVRMADGGVVRRVALSPRLFGEGLALWNGKLFQLTWRERTAIVYDRETFQEIKRFRYPGEGWGLTNNDTHLFMSDGSSTIRVLDPRTFREIRRFEVRGSRGPVTQLNELEWIDGEIWANIFQTNWIVRFSPENGRVLGFIDLHHLPPEEDIHPRQDVLNGIAVDPATGYVWVTGKYWKALYRIERPE